jgi:hypothetical protein
MRVYYHPNIGEYAKYNSFELDYALIGAGIGGGLAGGISYGLKKEKSSLWGLLGALAGGFGGGTLVPKRILSWMNPPPFDTPIVYPRQIPKTVISSFIGDAGQMLNLLMYQGSGNIVKDYSPYKRHGTIYNAIWRDGVYGWALFLNGTNAYVEVPPIPLNGEITVEAWIWDQNIYTNYAGMVFSWYYDSNNVFSLNHYSTTGLQKFDFILSGKVFKAQSTTTIPNRWLHTVGVLSLSQGFVKLYWDGQNIATTSVTPFTQPTLTPQYNRIGQYAGSYWFQGLIAMVRVYNRALTDAEIKHHYETTKSIFT